MCSVTMNMSSRKTSWALWIGLLEFRDWAANPDMSTYQIGSYTVCPWPCVTVCMMDWCYRSLHCADECASWTLAAEFLTTSSDVWCGSDFYAKSDRMTHYDFLWIAPCLAAWPVHHIMLMPSEDVCHSDQAVCGSECQQVDVFVCHIGKKEFHWWDFDECLRWRQHISGLCHLSDSFEQKLFKIVSMPTQQPDSIVGFKRQNLKSLWPKLYLSLFLWMQHLKNTMREGWCKSPLIWTD